MQRQFLHCTACKHTTDPSKHDLFSLAFRSLSQRKPSSTLLQHPDGLDSALSCIHTSTINVCTLYAAPAPTPVPLYWQKACRIHALLTHSSGFCTAWRQRLRPSVTLKGCGGRTTCKSSLQWHRTGNTQENQRIFNNQETSHQ